MTSEPGDLQLQSIAHGVILMDQTPSLFGVDRRRIRVQKLRGVNFRSGYHDMGMETGGLRVYPRLIAAEHRQEQQEAVISTGIDELDSMLGGGIDCGVSALLIGPAGSGKSTVAVQLLAAAAERGERGVLLSFEESPRTLYKRTRAIGIDLEKHVKSGMVRIQHIDPAELTPGEFVFQIRQDVEAGDVSLIVLDSLNGFLNAMPEERFVILQLHELLTYLGQKGVTAILVTAQHGLVSVDASAPIDVSYLADTVLLFRLFELDGELHQALSIIKRRGGRHDRSIRELLIGPPRGLGIGQKLHHLRGVMSGLPVLNSPAVVET
jgi:circadian clock protein KaiC